MSNYDNLQQRYMSLRKEYDAIYASTIELIPLDNVKLDEALKNQINIQLVWEEYYAKVRGCNAQIMQFVDESLSAAVSNEFSTSNRRLTITEAKDAASLNPKYLQWKRLSITTKELTDTVKGILEVVNSRKYTLNNLTNAHIATVHNVIL